MFAICKINYCNNWKARWIDCIDIDSDQPECFVKIKCQSYEPLPAADIDDFAQCTYSGRIFVHIPIVPDPQNNI